MHLEAKRKYASTMHLKTEFDLHHLKNTGANTFDGFPRFMPGLPMTTRAFNQGAPTETRPPKNNTMHEIELVP